MSEENLPKASNAAMARAESLRDDEVMRGVKPLSNGDNVWFLTNVECFEDRYSETSKARAMFKAWGYDVNNEKFGLFSFGLDFARDMVRAGVEPLPWQGPLKAGLSIFRRSHGSNGAGGRSEVQVKQFALPEGVLAKGAVQSPQRAKAEAKADADAETWQQWQPTSMVTEEDVEAAVPKLQSPFSRGDLVKAVGDPKAPITKVLRRLVRAGRLKSSGKGRAKKYELVYPDIERKDWGG